METRRPGCQRSRRSPAARQPLPGGLPARPQLPRPRPARLLQRASLAKVRAAACSAAVDLGSCFGAARVSQTRPVQARSPWSLLGQLARVSAVDANSCCAAWVLLTAAQLRLAQPGGGSRTGSAVQGRCRAGHAAGRGAPGRLLRGVLCAASTSAAAAARAPSDPGSQLWVEKHKPTCSSELAGNPGCINDLRTWLSDWCAWSAWTLVSWAAVAGGCLPCTGLSLASWAGSARAGQHRATIMTQAPGNAACAALSAQGA